MPGAPLPTRGDDLADLAAVFQGEQPARRPTTRRASCTGRPPPLRRGGALPAPTPSSPAPIRLPRPRPGPCRCETTAGPPSCPARSPG
jgi:hypothetical protein